MGFDTIHSSFTARQDATDFKQFKQGHRKGWKKIHLGNFGLKNTHN
jgi:hypothetical protein